MSIYDFADDVRGGGRSRRLLMDEDFSWSEVPRKRSSGPSQDSRTRAVVEEPAHEVDEDPYGWGRGREVVPYAGELEDANLSAGTVALPADGRRTIVITGHGAERNLPAPRRRSREAGLRVHERSGFKPDRIALWAFLLGLALLLGATTSSHAATLVHHLH